MHTLAPLAPLALLLLTAGCAPAAHDSDTAADTNTCDFSIDPCEANAAWITTCDAYPSIQAALDAASNGSTVHVCAGEHAESLHLSADDHADQHINLDGEGSGTTTVRAAPFDSSVDGADEHEAMVLYNDSVELDIAGLTFTGGSGYTRLTDTADADSLGGGAYLRDARVVMSDVIFTGNSARTGGAVYAEGADLKLTNCAIQSNTSDTAAAYLSNSALQSVHSDWGAGAQDNSPHDIAIAAVDDGAEVIADYETDASFTCSAQACTDN
jgi:predicted outer membrane repeat protein